LDYEIKERHEMSANEKLPVGTCRRSPVIRDVHDDCLQILPAKDNDYLSQPSRSLSHSASSTDRVTRTGRAPPIQRVDSATRRLTLTPTKQISLEAVKRKENAFELSAEYQRAPVPVSGEPKSDAVRRSCPVDTGRTVKQVMQGDSCKLKPDLSDASCKDGPRVNLNTSSSNNKTEEIVMSSENESESSESEKDSEPRKAPNELLIEFLECVMKKDYENARKLCTMVLLYEPDNSDALNFQSAIEQRLALDEESLAAERNTSDESESTDDDSDDASTSDEDDDGSSEEDDDTESSDDDEDVESTEVIKCSKTDSKVFRP